MLGEGRLTGVLEAAVISLMDQELVNLIILYTLSTLLKDPFVELKSQKRVSPSSSASAQEQIQPLPSLQNFPSSDY